MSKILKPYTIIPANLYVPRDADRQIESIIDDMGRPGYVLVSRQMGKTNLLLNAKRKLESSDDIFVYIDLSNPFETSKACFENIINSALEINEDKFHDIQEDIISRRKILIDTPPHKQHTNELRMLLRNIQGKLVIILDEIDALTKTPYSDQIFAQIRSVYFSRVNFKELERLTYILSGVVEPTDIIKDPKISPFNIGQKIFLNDFSKDEFLNFLQLSKLTLPTEIQERIYYWTHGSPRITWDLCSEIENKLLRNQSIDLLTVDKIIAELYLTTFDKPPIDNIRELAKQDREIRNAIVNINNNRSDTITDKIKNKLYLAGITNYNDTSVEIKNEVIKQSIKSDWIRSLEEEEIGLLKLAVESYSGEDYVNALNYFEKYLQNNDFGESINRPQYYYMMGFSSYKSNLFEKGIAYLELTNFDVSDEPKSYYEVIFLKGLCYTFLENYDEAHVNYKLIIDSGRNDETYIKSLINYGSVSVKANKAELLDDALEIFIAIIKDLDSDKVKIKKTLLPELKSISYYNTATIYSKKGDNELAETYLSKAMAVAIPESKPIMALGLINLVNTEEQKQTILEEIIDSLIKNEINPIEFDPEHLLRFSINELNELIIQTFLKFKKTLFLKLCPKLRDLFKIELGSIIFNLGLEELKKNDWNTAYEIFNSLSDELKSDFYNLNSSEKYETLKFSCYLEVEDLGVDRHIQFANMFVESNVRNPDVIDLENFAILILRLANSNRYSDSIKFIGVIKEQRSKNDDLLINYLLIDHLELNIFKAIGNKTLALQKAQEIIEKAKNPIIQNQQSALIGEDGLDFIRKNAERLLNIYSDRVLVKSHSKFGRNDFVKVRYNDGVMIETKFKKIEGDLNKGLCIILN